MPSKLQNLETIFTNIILRIPDYQRGYSWEKKHLLDLWNDLKNINIQSYHFTGVLTLERFTKYNKSRWEKEFELDNDQSSLVINKTAYTPYFIVDGQQRLVTLMILISVLKKSINRFSVEEKENILNKFISIKSDSKPTYLFGYEKDTPSHQYLIAKIFEDESMSLTEPETIYTHNLDKAKAFFLEQIKDLEESKREFLYKKVVSNLLFNVFEIEGEKIDMSLVFETLNYRGKHLSKLELFKNRLIFLITKRHPASKSYEIRERIIKTWQTIYEWLGKNPKKTLDDDEFLRAFWILFYNHDENTDDEFKKYEQDIFENKYRITEINSNDYLVEHNLIRLLETLASSIKIWFFIHNPYEHQEEFKFSFEVRRYLDRLLRINFGEFMKPLLVAYFLKNSSHSEIDSLVKNVERHNVCVYLIAGKQADTNRPYFYRIINQYFRPQGHFSHPRIISMINEKISAHMSFDNFFNHVHRNRVNNLKFYDWNGRKYILWEWEENLRGLASKFLKDYATASLELIFPDERSNLRYDKSYRDVKRQRNSESVNKLCYSLGNITISQNPRTPSSYEILREKLRSGGFSDRDIATNYIHWSDATIVDRGMRILEFMEKRWGIVFGKEAEKKRYLLDGVQLNNPN